MAGYQQKRINTGNMLASENFIAALAQLTFHVPIEGDIVEELYVVLEPGVDDNVHQRANFFSGDACSLSEYADDMKGIVTFGGVILANLLCRLPDPLACLDTMPKVVNKGRVMVTPFSCLEEFTPRCI